MSDMRSVIVPKSTQTNADDLIGGPKTIRITGVKIAPSGEQRVAISFDGDEGKPWMPCKSMCRVLVAAWGPDANAYTGRSVRLYNDPKVRWGGLEVGGIRISHMSHLDAPLKLALTESKGKRAPVTISVLPDEPRQEQGRLPAKAQAGVRDLETKLERAGSVDAVVEILAAHTGLMSWLDANRPSEADRLRSLAAQCRMRLEETTEPPEREPGSDDE